MSNLSDYIKRQKQWVDENKIEVGDLVTLTKIAEDFEGGWSDVWMSGTEPYLNKQGVITGIHDNGSGIIVSFENIGRIGHGANYPYTALDPVIKVKQEVKKDWYLLD